MDYLSEIWNPSLDYTLGNWARTKSGFDAGVGIRWTILREFYQPYMASCYSIVENRKKFRWWCWYLGSESPSHDISVQYGWKYWLEGLLTNLRSYVGVYDLFNTTCMRFTASYWTQGRHWLMPMLVVQKVFWESSWYLHRCKCHYPIIEKHWISEMCPESRLKNIV